MAALGLPGEVAADASRWSCARAWSPSTASRMLGDVGESAPEHWEFGGPATPRAAPAAAGLRDRCRRRWRELVDELAGGRGTGGLTELRRLETSDIGRAEHFGFRDGISQPRLAGRRQAPPPSDDQAVRRRRAGARLPRRVRPLRRLARWCRPSTTRTRCCPPDVEGSGARDLGRNGSYLVLRQLEQDVPAFWRFADAAGGRGPDRRLAAKMVGRWPSGAPLVLAPDADDPGIERDRLNAFRYHRRRSAGPQLPGGVARPPHQPARLARPRSRLERARWRSASTTGCCGAAARTAPGCRSSRRWRAATAGGAASTSCA